MSETIKAEKSSKDDQQQFWQMAIETWRASGLSVRQFCTKEGLSEPSFYSWRKKLAGDDCEQDNQHKPEPSAFIEVAMPQNTPAAIELLLTSGNTLRIPVGVCSDTQLLEARQKEAKPVFAEIKAALNEYKDQVLPKSLMGKAITYSFNQWEALNRYTDDPMLEIDNNLSERTLRMVVIGRKNYMFAGSESGAERAAIIYSLVASCKLHGIDPFEYFRDVLKRVGTHPQSRIDELLPCNWKPPLKKAKIAEEDIAA